MSSNHIADTLLNENPAAEVEGFDDLVHLASNLRWSWTHAADAIWEQLDPDLWKYTHNPWVMLQTVSREKLKEILAEKSFKSKIDALLADKKSHEESEKWFQKEHDNSPLKSIAYFCMEYMLSEALPIYSGGLGNVAGDQLKAASDLGVPVTAIGLLYQRGYFRQGIDKEGQQLAFYPSNNSWQLPTIPVRNKQGEWLRIKIDLPQLPIWLRVWKVQVGCASLYLLDSNDGANFPPFRGITSELYGGDKSTRLMQEIILGIGGWKLLEELEIAPEVCHLNEGHAAFAVLARAHSYMKKHKVNFYEALTITRAGNLFTTHTAVKAGFDYFDPKAVEHYLGEFAEKELGISVKEFLAFGRKNADDESEHFNMAYLAIRCSGVVNGVSQLHARVSRHLFNPVFDRWPTAEVPVSAVTNGIHVASWESAPAAKVWNDSCGEERWDGSTEHLEAKINKIEDNILWDLRNSARKLLVEFARERITLQQTLAGESSSTIRDCKDCFNENILTLGFARRFATYKRPTLLLHDPERFVKILTNHEKPVQLVISGKAHPADKPGQALIKKWKEFIDQYKVENHVIFLSDYDMLLTEQMVHGVDVWVNTPRRPWEACGTSGMKVLVNGGLNLSELDGWWAEAYNPDIGWALGDGQEHDDDEKWDAIDAEQLYKTLEEQVIPEFYTRNDKKIPKNWVDRMRKSMARLTPYFCANRAVRDYVEKQYLPAATRYTERSANESALGLQIAQWKKDLHEHWSTLAFEGHNANTQSSNHEFNVTVNLGKLDPKHVKIQMFANKASDTDQDVIIDMKAKDQNSDGKVEYSASVPEGRPIGDYAIRAVPYHEGALVPLESQFILWKK